jgi:hypothetical protein
MEHRSDLEDILLNGLPEQERRHVVKVMQQVTAAKLRVKRSEGVRDDDPIDLTDLDDHEHGGETMPETLMSPDSGR